jgi:hypothetical protein
MRLDRSNSMTSRLAIGAAATRRRRPPLKWGVIALCALAGVSLDNTPASAQTCTIQWVGPATGGNWASALSWSPARLPTSTDVACTGTADLTVSFVSVTGSYSAQQLVAGGSITIASNARLTLGQGGTIAGNLAFTGGSLLSAGTLSIGGLISSTSVTSEIAGVSPSLTISARGFSLADRLTIGGAVVSVTGASTLTSLVGQLRLLGSIVTIEPTATFDLGNGTGVFGDQARTSQLINRGVIRRSAPTGQAGVNTFGGLVLRNEGRLEVLAGPLRIGNTTFDQYAGAIELRDDSAVTSDDVVFLRGGQLTGSGSVTVTGTGTLLRVGAGASLNPGGNPGWGYLTVSGRLQIDPGADVTLNVTGTSFGQFDLLNVIGVADLNGRLVVPVSPTFVPPSGTRLRAITYGSHTGVFASVSSPWTVDYQATATAAELVVAAATPPTSNNDSYTTPFDTPLSVAAPGVLANDSANGGGILTATPLTSPANGTLNFVSDGSFTFTPAAGFSGQTSFTYRPQTTFGPAGNTATVTITVNPPPPRTAADSYSTPLNTPLVVAAPGVLANDSANGGGGLTAVLITGPASGTLSLASNGSFTYTPPPAFSGPISFTYRTQTTNGGPGNTATVSITVNPAPAPTGVPDSYATALNTPLTIATPGLLDNDSANGGGTLTAVLVAGPTSGSLSLATSGAFTYWPSSGFGGQTSFTYRPVSANGGEGNTTTVTITVIGRPAAMPDTYNTPFGAPLAMPAPGVLGNDLANGGTGLIAVLDANPSNGTLIISPNGSFTYTPNANYSGTDSFTYHAAASGGASNPETVRITVASPGLPSVRSSPFLVSKVGDVALSATTVYVAGNFPGVSAVGDYTGGFVAVDPVTARKRMSPTPQPDSISSMAPDGNGGFFLGGRFLGATGAVDGIVHVLPDGSRDGAFGFVTSLGAPNKMTYGAGRLYVSILRPQVGPNEWDETVGTLRAIDVSNGQVLSFNPFPRACYPYYDSDYATHVTDMFVAGSRLILAGDFGQIAGLPCSGSLSSFVAIDLNPGGVTSSIGSQAIYDFGPIEGGLVYLAGHNFLGRLDVNTLSVTVIATVTDALPIHRIARVAGQIVIAGQFGGSRTWELRAYDLSGQRLPWQPALGAQYVTGLAAGGSTVYASGRFTPPGGGAPTSTVAFDMGSGGLPVSWNPMLNGYVSGLEISGGLVAIAGGFSATNAQSRDGLAAFDAATGTLLPWRPATRACPYGHVPPSHVVVSGGAVFAESCYTLRKLDATTGDDVVFSFQSLVDAYAIAADQTTLYVAGYFFQPGTGIGQDLIIALDSSSGVERWRVAITGANRLTRLAVADSSLYVSTFQSVAGVSSPDRPLARLSTSTGAVLSPGLTFSSRYEVHDLQSAGGALYVAGSFWGSGTGVFMVIPTGEATLAWFPAAPGAAATFRGLWSRRVAVQDPAKAVVIGSWTDLVTYPPWIDLDRRKLSLSVSFQPRANAEWTTDGDVHKTLSNGRITVATGTFSRVSGVFTGPVAILDAPPSTLGAPTATGDSYTTPFQTVLAVPAPGVLANDSDNGGGMMSAELISWPATGGLTFSANGGFTIAPPTGFTGILSFTYRARTAAGVSAPATVSVAVAAAGAPVAVADAYSSSQGLTLSVPAPGVTGNDLSPGNAPLSAALVSSPSFGNVILSPSGAFVYTPAAGFVGMDSFSYRVSNSSGNSNPAVVTLNVIDASQPQPPTAVRVVSVAGNVVTIRWTAPVGSPPSGYVLEGGVTPGQTLASVPTGSDEPVFVFSAPTGSFFVRIRALRGGVLGPASVDVPLHVGSAVVPSAPTSLLGMANGSNLALSWQDTFTGGVPTSHVLEVSGSAVLSVPLGPAETFAFSGVPPGTYTFAVRAANVAGVGASSDPVTITFPVACSGAPQAPLNFITQKVGGMLHLAWDQPITGSAATGYVLIVGGTVSATLPMSGRSLSVAAPAGVFTLSVMSTNACGVSEATSARTVQFP